MIWMKTQDSKTQDGRLELFRTSALFCGTWRTLRLGGSLLLLAHASANEALDVLEGKKDPAAVDLPPVEGEGTAESAAVAPVPKEWPPSPLDPVWARAVLFEDPANPWVQQLAITGLFHWQGAWGEATPEGGKEIDIDGTRTRRARLGARLKAFRNTEIEAVAEFAGDSNYNGIERLQGKTTFLDNAYVKYGKMRPGFTTEYRTEPQHALTPERSFLVNMVAPASTLGLMVGQDTERWDWGLGWFSSDNDSNIPGVEGDGFLLANLALESWEKAEGAAPVHTRWHADYIYNFDDKSSPAIPRYNVAGRRSANGNQLIARNPAFQHLFSTGVGWSRAASASRATSSSLAARRMPGASRSPRATGPCRTASASWAATIMRIPMTPTASSAAWAWAPIPTSTARRSSPAMSTTPSTSARTSTSTATTSCS
jgi:hypothetical protein